MGALWFKPTSLLTPAPNTLDCWMSRVSRAPNSTRRWRSKKGREPVALQRDVCMSLSLPETVPSLMCGSAQQVPPDLMLWGGVGGREGRICQSWSPLNSPRRKSLGTPCFVTAKGSAPSAQSACQQDSQTFNHSRREIQAQSGRGTQSGSHSTLRGRAKVSWSPGGHGVVGLTAGNSIPPAQSNPMGEATPLPRVPL